MLKMIHQYIKKQGIVSLKELAMHFQMIPEALEPIIERLIVRFDIREAAQSACKELCQDCESPRYFEAN